MLADARYGLFLLIRRQSLETIETDDEVVSVRHGFDGRADSAERLKVRRNDRCGLCRSVDSKSIDAGLPQKFNQSTCPASYVQDRGRLDLARDHAGNEVVVLWIFDALAWTSSFVDMAVWLRT